MPIINAEKLAPVLRSVRTEPIYADLNRAAVAEDAESLDEIPFLAIIDDGGKAGVDRVIAVKSASYSLISNTHLVGVAERAAAHNPLVGDLVVNDARYARGRTEIGFRFPGLEFTPDGDKSAIVPLMYFENDYTGGFALRAGVAIERQWCSNRARLTQRLAQMKRVHRGLSEDETNTTLDEFVNAALGSVASETAYLKDLITAACGTELPAGWSDTWIERVCGETSKRYHEAFGRNVEKNLGEIGNNAWAWVNGISQTFEHDMPASVGGSFGLVDWRDRWTRLPLNDLGVYETVNTK
jgi:hypothetical protein